MNMGVSILVAFLNIYRYYFLILHQNLPSGSFLKLSCHVECKFLSMKFLFLLHLNPLVCLAHQMALLSMPVFVTSHTGHFESTGSLH